MLTIRPAAVSGFTAREVGKPVLDSDGRHVADVVDVRGGRLYVAVAVDATDLPAAARSEDASPRPLSREAVARVGDDAVHLTE